MATPPGYAQCSYELRHSLMQRSAFLTFGIDPTGTDPNTIASQVAIRFAAVGSLFSVLDSQVTLIATRVSLGTDGGEDIVGLSTTPVACTKTLTSVPANCAVLVHKRTARGGRRGRGRMYLPWAVGVTDVGEGGAITTTPLNLIGAAVNVWMGELSSGPGPLVILHRESAPGTDHPSVPGPPNTVTSMTVDSLIATQRRRLGR